MSKTIVGVTGINASDNPAPGIGVAKSLKRDDANVTVIGLAYDAMEPGIYLDWFIDKSYMIPYPTAGDRVLVDRLLYIRSQTGMSVVIPTLDSELPFYIRVADELRSHGLHTFLPDEKQFRLRDKQRLEKVAASAQIRFPKQYVINSTIALAHIAPELGYPLMIKGGVYSAHRAEDLQEAMAHFSLVVAKWGYPVIAQQVIVGEEMNVIGVGDGYGDAPGLVAIKKMSTTGFGKIWTGVTVDHPQLLEAAKRFVRNTRWRGAFELECIIYGDDIYLIEVNPRFPAWVYFATGVGINLPAMLVKRALGESIDEDIGYDPGKLYVRYTDERVCDMRTFQNMVTLGES